MIHCTVVVGVEVEVEDNYGVMLQKFKSNLKFSNLDIQSPERDFLCKSSPSGALGSGFCGPAVACCGG